MIIFIPHGLYHVLLCQHRKNLLSARRMRLASHKQVGLTEPHTCEVHLLVKGWSHAPDA